MPAAKKAAKKTAPVETAAPKKAVKKAAAPEKKSELVLPPGVKPGAAITCTYSDELSLQRGLKGTTEWGSYHGILKEVTGDLIAVLYVFPGGKMQPDLSHVNLRTGIDVDYDVAVSEIKVSPIPLKQLEKWRAAGEAGAAAAQKEEPEDEEDEEAGEDYNDGGDEDGDDSKYE
jgi:hypothetical protein